MTQRGRCGCLTPGLGIALAGGGGRGLAQIGVLKVLDAEALSVSVVAGTSIGARFGGLYVLEGNAESVEARILALFDGDEARHPPKSCPARFHPDAVGRGGRAGGAP